MSEQTSSNDSNNVYCKIKEEGSLENPTDSNKSNSQSSQKPNSNKFSIPGSNQSKDHGYQTPKSIGNLTYLFNQSQSRDPNKGLPQAK